MRLSKLLATFVLALPFALAAPPATAIEAGKDYLVLSPAQPRGLKSKVEVVEFFAYTCPHCFELEPELNLWAKKLPKNVVLKRQPVIFNDSWEPMARAYFALEALGQVDRLHADVFDAIHVEDQKLTEPAVFFDWAAKHGVDKARLMAAYNSFGVSAKVARAKQMGRAYKLSGVPTLAVNGRYLTSAAQTGSHVKALEVVDALIRQESKRRHK